MAAGNTRSANSAAWEQKAKIMPLCIKKKLFQIKGVNKMWFIRNENSCSR